MKNNSSSVDFRKKKETATDKISRRNFVRNTALAFAGFSIVPRFVLGRGFTAPSDKINLGYIGLGKQGNILANKFLSNTQAQIVAGSEVWDTKRAFFKKNVEAMYAAQRNITSYNGVNTYLDYQEMLERKDIDAVVVATPDHWHSLQCVDAMKAGKDVYCEKPLTNTIKEGRKIVTTAEKTERVFQTGSMQRSWDRFKKAQQLVSSGALGEIKKVLVNVGDPAIKYNLSPEPLPEGVDWNLWCGPAPLLAYNDKIAPPIVKTYPDWRNFEETGGGILADWGAHMFDIAQWALGMDHTGPVTYIPPSDPKAVRGLRMYYENGVEMVHEDFGRGWGVRFIGTEGNLDVSRSFLETTPASILGTEDNPELYKGQNNHYQDWISAIKTRSQPLVPAEIGHRTATICNIANIAYNLNRPLNWNPKKERFKGDSQANKSRKQDIRNFS